MKIELEKRKIPEWHGPGNATTHITASLPFLQTAVRGSQGGWVHRVRSGHAHWRDGTITHISMDFWCGNVGFLGKKGTLLAEPPNGAVQCQRCIDKFNKRKTKP